MTKYARELAELNLTEDNPDTYKRLGRINWWCDRCKSLLNEQKNFNDSRYIWKCTECGYKNIISSDNIIDPPRR